MLHHVRSVAKIVREDVENAAHAPLARFASAFSLILGLEKSLLLALPPDPEMPSDPNELQPPAPPSQPLAQAAAPEKHSYGDISSSAMIGGASMLNIAIGIVRTKVMAVLLGPGQFGVMDGTVPLPTLRQALPEWASAAVGSRSLRPPVPAIRGGLPVPSLFSGEPRRSSA